MSVHRLAKYQTDDPFTRIPNSAVNDQRLDLKARGLLLLMLSKPDGWTFRERHLATVAGVGRDQLRAAMQTLIDTGYVVRTRESDDGKPPVCVTRVYDVPQTRVGLPEVGFPDRGETRPLSNEGVLVTNEKNLAAAPREAPTRKADDLFETVAQVCGISLDGITRTARGQLNKAVKELREVQATPEQIHHKAKAYRTQYPNATLTPTALTKHWSSFAQLERKQQRPSVWDTYEPPEYY
jgi:hypothetical protein